ncbi:MAG: hypothetical protein WCW84_07735 [Sulfurimonas sp.]|jgi:hypothetical protein
MKMKAQIENRIENDRKNHPVCGNCGQMTHGMPDDIDAYADAILAKLEN